MLSAADRTGDSACIPGATASANAGMASVAGLLLKLMSALPRLRVELASSYLAPMIEWSSAPMECPTPNVGMDAYRVASSATSARRARSNANCASSAMRMCSNPMANGVATIVTFALAQSRSRKSR